MIFFGRRGDLMVVVRWTPGGEGSGFETGPGHCVVFWGKILYAHSLSLHGEVDEILGDNLAMDCHSREGGEQYFLLLHAT